MPFKLGPDEERRRLLEREVRRMTALFPRMGVKKAILFGSLARGDVIETSDIDLILVMETPRRFLDRLDEAFRVLRPKTGLDVLVYTPDEFEELLETRPFVQKAVREGKVIYEARSS
ncbi:MAG TPA: nucleotidyltransferase domain-containing protein [Clostridiales bacterium]|nr:nucleotidyltransferase domain-containing protein [Clostridiales bacterium]